MCNWDDDKKDNQAALCDNIQIVVEKGLLDQEYWGRLLCYHFHHCSPPYLKLWKKLFFSNHKIGYFIYRSIGLVILRTYGFDICPKSNIGYLYKNLYNCMYTLIFVGLNFVKNHGPKCLLSGKFIWRFISPYTPPIYTANIYFWLHIFSL